MAATKQTIQDFYRVAQGRDFARDIQFRVLNINPKGTSVKFDENDLVYAKAAELPARAITPVQAKYMGLEFNLPGVAKYPESDSYTLQFYCAADSALRRKFEQWSRDTFDDQNSTGNYLTPVQGSTIDLIQLDHKLEKINQYQLVGVSLRNIGKMSYSMADGTGTVMSFPVTLAYHYWVQKND